MRRERVGLDGLKSLCGWRSENNSGAARFWRVPLMRQGVTNFGAISLTVCPGRRNSRARWCAPEQASMPIRHGGNWMISAGSWSRGKPSA